MKKEKVSAMKKDGKPLKNPFQDYQMQQVAEREVIISGYLASLSRTRAKFEYVTDLAKAVAEQVELAEGKSCSFTTLLRNKRYKALLMNFMVMRYGTDAVQVSDIAAQAVIYTVELQNENFKRDNERLRTYMAELESRLAKQVPSVNLAPLTLANEDDITQLSNDKAIACKTLWLVLDHFKDLVSIDNNRGCIIDLSASKHKNVIVDPEIARVFLDWLRANAQFGL